MSAVTPLAEFLSKKAEEYKEITEKNQATIEEWQSAVAALHSQILEWLSTADLSGLVEREQGKEKVTEPELGQYQIQRLALRAFGKWIGILPKARFNMKNARPAQKSIPANAAGRVDITDEIRRYVLYRVGQDGSYLWMMDDQTGHPPQPLDRQSFEYALMSYLQ